VSLRGARHGHKMNAKLLRIQAQEAELLAKLEGSEVKVALPTETEETK